ncbi:iron-sulfur cluster-binding domain-containing protein [Pseudoflavitalea sp. X16]|uniref:flavin reductase family protein n=1 Tax=Paraflavitalea devenefica TaxID=2716334 RepID=UPI00141F7164|nr:iron-sulfur cluster-binding domain-containing protein [Paraflavitalea devenefica]NII29013.1 iron-sulfur cluster-binding domain-containing protein [Paraflavitalea devenefica]
MNLLQWKVVRLIPEAKDTISYVLEEISGQPVVYEAGQFLTFLFNYHGQEIRRSYSMGSAPGIDTQVFITVKKKENGSISRYILEHWHEGTVILSLPASGRFTLATDPSHKRQVCFIAAGSGIVPVFALLKKLLQEEPHSQALLLYQNHDENNIIYHAAIQQLAEQYPARFSRIDLLSHPILHDLPHQRLNNGLLEAIVTRNTKPETRNTFYYTCGPASFMRMVQFTLRVMGVDESRLRKENFTVDTVPPPAFTIDPAPRNVQVKQGERLYQFTVSYPDTILQAALNHHIKLPYSCRGGRCSTCTARCLSGTVKMNINEVLTEQDLQNGLVLTCVGYALTDLVLEL